MIIRLEQLKKWLKGASKEERMERTQASPETSQQDATTPVHAQAQPDAFKAFADAANAYQSQTYDAYRYQMMANQHAQAQAQAQARANQQAQAFNQAMLQSLMQYPSFEVDAQELIRENEVLAEFNHFFAMRTPNDNLVGLMKWMRDNCADYFAILPVKRHTGYLVCFANEHDAVAFRLSSNEQMKMLHR